MQREYLGDVVHWDIDDIEYSEVLKWRKIGRECSGNPPDWLRRRLPVSYSIELAFTDCIRVWFVENVSSKDLRWVKVVNTYLEVTPLLTLTRSWFKLSRGQAR